MKYSTLKNIAAVLTLLTLAVCVSAQVKKPKVVKAKTKTTTTAPVASKPVSTGKLSNDEIAFGLKDALSNGVRHAVESLSKRGGFYNNERVKIPVPKALQPVEKTLRFLKQDDMVDDFVVSMNHAAEQAVAEALMVFGDAVKQMTIQDAYNILTGPQDSATQFFKRTSEEKLRIKFLPIVQTTTEEAGVTAQYKKMMEKGGGLMKLTGAKDFDLDKYVTEKALDGLFLLVADEEKRIRENPVARTTSILQKVFGSIIK